MKSRPLGGNSLHKKGIRPGESSSSNPSVTLHRDAARAYRKRKLRELVKAEVSSVVYTKSGSAPVDSDTEENHGLSVTPAGVFLGLNPQPPPLQKFVNAALDTCGEVLRERLPEDFADSFCAYFSALQPLLESTRDLVQSARKCNNEEKRLQLIFQISGIVYPFSAVVRRVPAPLIQKNWLSLSRVVLDLLPIADLASSDPRSYQDSDSECDEPQENADLSAVAGVLLLRSLLGMASRLLHVRVSTLTNWKVESEDWRLPNGISAKLFAFVFHYTFHSKPRVRRIAHAAIVRILSHPDRAFSSGFVAKQAADLLFVAIKKSSNGSETNEPMLRRSLALMKDVAQYLPSSNVKSLAELLLTFTVLGSHTVRFLAYAALTACCANNSEPSELRDSKESTSLAESLAAALMTDFRPPVIVASSTIPYVLISVYSEWLRCVQVAHLAVLNRSPAKALAALPRLIDAIFNVFTTATSSAAQSNDDNGMSNERNKLSSLTADLFQTWIGALSQLCRQFNQNNLDRSEVETAVESIVTILESSLGFEHHECWPQILHFIASLVSQLGGLLPMISALVSRLLPVLSELHFSASSRLSSEANVSLLLSAVDEVFGASIASLGPEFVVKTVSYLELPAEILSGLRKSDVDGASWILSLLSRYAGNTGSENQADSRLPYFIKQLLPLQDRLHKAIAAEKAANNGEPSAFLLLLYSRVWSTLPAFCTTSSPSSPIIVPPEFARLVGERLTNDAAIRTFLLNALRRLVENAPSQLSRYGKNFLPILFNLHINQADQANVGSSRALNYAAAEDDGLVLQTIRLWFSHPDAITLELAQHFLDRTWGRLNEAMAKLKAAIEGSSMDTSNDTENAKTTSLPPLLVDLCVAILGRFSPKFTRTFLTKTQRASVVELLTFSQLPTLQKRAYKLIEDVLEIVILRTSFGKSESAEHLLPEERYAFVRDEVQPLLAEALPKTSAPVRRARLTCLLAFAKAALLTANGTDGNAFYSALLWEAVASLVDVNTRARMAAMKLVIFISSAIVSPAAALSLCSDKPIAVAADADKSDDESVHCRLEALLRLLLDRLPLISQLKSHQQSSVDGCCAVLIAIGKVFRNFKNPLIHEHVDVTLDRVVPLLLSSQSPSLRRVVRCVLQMISSAISSLPGSELECILAKIVPIVTGTSFSEIHRRALRTTLERILLKITKKCGPSKVIPLISDLLSNELGGDEKRLRHLLRTLKRTCSNAHASRAERKSDNASDSEDDSDDEGTGGDNERASRPILKAKKGKTSGMQIVEDADDIADAVAPGSALRLAAKQHSLMTAKPRLSAMNADTKGRGKIVVKRPRMSKDDNDDEDEANHRDSDDYFNSDGDDDSDAGNKRITKDRKRPKSSQKQPRNKTTGRPGNNKKGRNSGKGQKKKGETVQPFSYRPLQRHMLNRRRSVQFRDKKRK